MSRKFYIEADGVRTNLNGTGGVWFFEPEGLGVTFANKYSDTSDGFFYKTQNKQKQGSVTGTLLFMGSSNPYTMYESFVNTLFTASELVLVYDPCGTEYKAPVSVNYIQKGEAIGAAALKTSVSFTLEGLWYTETTLTGTGSVSVTAGGQVGWGIRLTTTGTALLNPKITVTKSTSGDVVAATVTTTTALATTDVVEYSNYWDDMHITLNGSDNLGSVDFSDGAVFGHTTAAATVRVTDDNNASPAISVYVRKYWRTV